MVNSATAIGATLAKIPLFGERDLDLFLEILLLFLLGEASRLGENPLELDDHPPLRLRGDLETLLNLGDRDRDLEYLPRDLLLELEYLLGDLEYLLGDGEYLLGELENLLRVGDLLRDGEREYLPRLLDLDWTNIGESE